MRAFQLFSATLLLLGASTGQLYAQDTPPIRDSVPEQWQYKSPNFQTLPPDDRWWQALNESALDSLIDYATTRNFNLMAALHRINAAKQAVTQARSGYYPTIGLSAGYNYARSSGAVSNPVMKATNSSYFDIGANMSWEIDLFGKVAAKARQAKAQYNATRAEYTAAMVSMAGDVARYYCQLRTLQQELIVAKAHIISQDSVLHLAEARHEAGLNSKLDITQARTIYYSTLATIPALEAQIASTKNAISLLVADNPAHLDKILSTSDGTFPEFRQIVSIGIPAELIRRRPDIIEAEANLATAAADVGVAKRDFLPTLTLTGSIGTTSHKAKNLFSKESFGYSIAPVLSWTVFDGFARRANVAQAKEQMLASLDAYNLAVFTAFEEVDNAMITYTASLKNIEYLQRVVNEAHESLTLSVDLYRGGLTSFTNVADAQISYLQYADALVQAQGTALTALINLYTALGGGWTTE